MKMIETYSCITILLMVFFVSNAVADIYFYTDKNGIRHFTSKPNAPEYKLFVRDSVKSFSKNSNTPRLSIKANHAISSLKSLNSCLRDKGGCLQLYIDALLETAKWLESEEARWSQPVGTEIRAALKDYAIYYSLSFRKRHGFGEGSKGRIEKGGSLWLGFIEDYPIAINNVQPNLDDMMICVLESAKAHTNQALEYMIDIARVLQGRK